MSAEESPTKELGDIHSLPLTDAEKAVRLESIIQRQRTVVIDQRSAISGLLEQVSELERIVKGKDEEIAELQLRIEQQNADVPTPNPGNAARSEDLRADFVGEVATNKHGVHQQLQETEQARRRVEDELKDAAKREVELQEEVNKLRQMMADKGSPVSSLQKAAPVLYPHTPSPKLYLPLPVANKSASPSPSKNLNSKDDKLGQVRSNLLAAEEAIEKLRVKVSKNSSRDSSLTPSPHRRSPSASLRSSLSPAPPRPPLHGRSLGF